jgi:kynurenine formamidase
MRNLIFLTLASAALAGLIALSGARAEDLRLWEIYDNSLKQAKYIDLTHAFSPSIPVWPGFGHAQFRPTVAGAAIPGEVERGQEFTYAKDGFVASAYDLPTDQYGTQLDPPAHWDEYGATISDLPPTYAVRPLVVIDIHEKVAADRFMATSRSTPTPRRHSKARRG